MLDGFCITSRRPIESAVFQRLADIRQFVRGWMQEALGFVSHRRKPCMSFRLGQNLRGAMKPCVLEGRCISATDCRMAVRHMFLSSRPKCFIVQRRWSRGRLRRGAFAAPIYSVGAVGRVIRKERCSGACLKQNRLLTAAARIVAVVAVGNSLLIGRDLLLKHRFLCANSKI